MRSFSGLALLALALVCCLFAGCASAGACVLPDDAKYTQLIPQADSREMIADLVPATFLTMETLVGDSCSPNCNCNKGNCANGNCANGNCRTFSSSRSHASGQRAGLFHRHSHQSSKTKTTSRGPAANAGGNCADGNCANGNCTKTPGSVFKTPESGPKASPPLGAKPK